MATLIGSGLTNYRLALHWANLTTFAGSICAIFLAQELMQNFSGKGILPDNFFITTSFVIALAGGAALTVLFATIVGLPISTTHALIGGMIGSTLLAAGEINLLPLLKLFLLPLFISPIVSMLVAYLLSHFLDGIMRVNIFSKRSCICDEAQTQLITVNGQTNVFEGEIINSVVVAPLVECEKNNRNILFKFNSKIILDKIHWLSAGSVCFARGLNDTPKIAALLLMTTSFNLNYHFLIIGLAMILGSLLNSQKVSETMSHKITTLTHEHGLSANLTTATLVIFASKLGMPVSTTHVSVGSIVGIGLNNSQTNKGKISLIALSWLLTLPCAALFSAIIYFCLPSL